MKEKVFKKGFKASGLVLVFVLCVGLFGCASESSNSASGSDAPAEATQGVITLTEGKYTAGSDILPAGAYTLKNISGEKGDFTVDSENDFVWEYLEDGDEFTISLKDGDELELRFKCEVSPFLPGNLTSGTYTIKNTSGEKADFTVEKVDDFIWQYLEPDDEYTVTLDNGDIVKIEFACQITNAANASETMSITAGYYIVGGPEYARKKSDDSTPSNDGSSDSSGSSETGTSAPAQSSDNTLPSEGSYDMQTEAGINDYYDDLNSYYKFMYDTGLITKEQYDAYIEFDEDLRELSLQLLRMS
jgi:hypothetical protein